MSEYELCGWLFATATRYIEERYGGKEEAKKSNMGIARNALRMGKEIEKVGADARLLKETLKAFPEIEKE